MTAFGAFYPGGHWAREVTCFVREDPNPTVVRIKKEFCGIVESQMKRHTVISFKDGNETCNNDQTDKTMVICPVSSRIASDAKHATKDIQGHQNMALVFIHHVAKHIPFNLNSQSVLTDDEYTSLGAMIDVVFFQGEGIYNCPANIRAIQNFCKFLKDRSIKQIDTTENNGSNLNNHSRGRDPIERISVEEGSIVDVDTNNSYTIPEPTDCSGNQGHQLPASTKHSPQKPRTSTQSETSENQEDYRPKLLCCLRSDPSPIVLLAQKEFCKRVESQMKLNKHQKVLFEYGNETCIHKAEITALICPVSSRLASNAKHAMRGIRGHQNMALVFFHHVARHMPFNFNSASVLTDDEYKPLGAMIDVVFFQGEGIYNCPANTRAIKQFCRFLEDKY